MNPDNFCLGTAQLGLDGYGVNNDLKADKGRALEVLQTFYDLGGRWVDTAQSYGNAEEWIAEWAPEDVQVVTKTDRPYEPRGLDWIELYHGDGRFSYNYNGASVYEVDSALWCIGEQFEAVQVPFNLFDKERWLAARLFIKAYDLGVTVFVRSVYLQGKCAGWPNPDKSAHAVVNHFWTAGVDIVGSFNNLAAYAYWYVRYHAPHAIPVIGCETPEQVEENVRIASLFDGWDDAHPADDPDIYDPRRWVDE